MEGSRVSVLGSPRIERGAERIEPAAGKQSAILYYLACQPGWVSRDDLLYLLYPDLEDGRARNNLRPLLSKLRRAHLAEDVQIEPTRLRWDVTTDVQGFRDAVAAKDYVRADELYAGDLLEGFRLPSAPEFESWLTYERAELREAWRGAVVALAENLRAQGRPLDGARLLERLRKADPLDEDVVRRYLTALTHAGRGAEAVRAYKAFEALLEREVGAEPEPATHRCVEVHQGSAFKGASARVGPDLQAPVPVPRGNLPTPSTPFIGREREVTELAARLRDPDCRLVTIVAPGGMGKTRVAIETAHRLGGAFAEGAHLVALEAVPTPNLLVSALAEAFAMTFFGPEEPRRQLLEYLRTQETLLVLDNFEHLLDHAGSVSFITELLESAPAVTLLCTSRARLGVRAEWVYDLDGMALPRDGEPVRAADAVEFFVRAAGRIRPDDALDDSAIVRICRLVKGMPLALELAASWLRALSVEEVARELEAGPDLLDASLRDLPERHRSLRTVFDASWLRLSHAERAALLRIAVFHDGVFKHAAWEVAEVGLPLLLALVNKSFLRREPDGRFTQHPLLWQYVREKAMPDPGFAQVQERHAEYFATFLQAREVDMQGLDAHPAREEVSDVLANVRAAWAWAVEQSREDVLGRAAEGLYLYHSDEGRYHEAEELFAAAVAVADAEGATAGRLLCFLGGCHNFLARHEQALPTLDAALSILQHFGAKREAGMTLHFQWSCQSFTDRPFVDVAPLVRRARLCFRDAGDLAHEAESVGLLAEYVEDPRVAEDNFQESIRLFRASGRCHAALGGVTLALSNYALFAMQVLGAYEKAFELLDEAIQISQTRREPYSSAWYLNNQAELRIYQGDLDGAERGFSKAKATGEALTSGWGTWTFVQALFGLGWLARVRGDTAEAGRYLDLATTRIETHGNPFGTEASIQLALGSVALAEGRTAEATELSRHALRHFASLNLQREIRQWGTARSLIQLAEIACLDDGWSVAGERFEQALAIVRRWHLRPLALHLVVSVTPFLRSRGDEAQARRLLELVTRHPASMFETRSSALRQLGANAQAVNLEALQTAASCIELLGALDPIVGRMRMHG